MTRVRLQQVLNNLETVYDELIHLVQRGRRWAHGPSEGVCDEAELNLGDMRKYIDELHAWNNSLRAAEDWDKLLGAHNIGPLVDSGATS